MKEMWRYFVFLFPYLLNVEWILKLQTQHKKSVQTCNFHNKEILLQDILMLAKLLFMLLFFLMIIQPWAALKPSLIEFSFSFSGNFFLLDLRRYLDLQEQFVLFYFLYQIRLRTAFFIWKKYDKGFWLFSTITKVFCLHGSLKMNQKWRLHYNKRP